MWFTFRPFIVSLMGLIVISALCRTAQGSAPPNIVFLLTDDQRSDTLGCAGNKVIQTPNIDRLAKEGTRFQNAFVTTSICMVSRASIMLGQYEARHGIHDFQTSLSSEQQDETYFGHLRRAGYRLGFVGKWGVGTPPKELFDYAAAFGGQGFYFDPNDSEKPHLTIQMGDSALEFLAECESDRPFCLSVSFKAPHVQDQDLASPFPFEPDLEPLYGDITIRRYPLSETRYFERLPPFLQANECRKRWRQRFETPEKYQKSVKGYYRLISGVDRVVGRIRDKLAEMGADQNTIIVFTSDNGFFLGENGWAGKWLPHEPSIRVPLIVYDPRLEDSHRGRIVRAIALNIDIAPTLLDYARRPDAPTMQGRSLRPFVEGSEVADWRSDFYYEHQYAPQIIPPSEALRTERYKYARYPGQDPVYEQLFDLRDDPHETRNLIGMTQYQQLSEELRRRLSKVKSMAR